jgi:hypothetical protein
MKPYNSLETRWFVNREQYEELLLGLAPLGFSWPSGLEIIFPRLDMYLHMPLVEEIGIKFRDPKPQAADGGQAAFFEVKLRMAEKSVRIFTEQVAGYTSAWQKFSYKVSETGSGLLRFNPDAIGKDSAWILLEKDRLLKKFNAETNTLVNADTLIAEGCGIEITRLRHMGRIFFSFGLEAFSTAGHLLDDNFEAAIRFILPYLPVRGLGLDNSYDYPTFLETLEAGK